MGAAMYCVMAAAMARIWIEAMPLLFVGFCLCGPVSGTPLDDYILQPDPHFSWFDTDTRVKGWFPTGRWEGHVLNMTSQGWLSTDDVDCAVWTHHLVIVKPGSMKFVDTAFMLIGGGSNTNDPPTAKDELLELAAAVAVNTKTITAVLYQVPNQPCRFTSDGSRMHRYEDDLIAYTWYYFMKHPDSSRWLARLPMTKSSVRAMDVIQEYASLQLNAKVSSFVVAGASKRGWTTWTTGAVDKRVVGIIPIVMDALNFVPNLHHFYQSLGGWTFAFEPYYALNITAQLDTPEMVELMSIVDPLVYKERLTMPKLIVIASNDEFFFMDDSLYYWNELKGEKHLLVLANTEHSLATGLVKLVAAAQAFYLSIVTGNEKVTSLKPSSTENDLVMSIVRSTSPAKLKISRPSYWWQVDRDRGILQIKTLDKPLRATMWYAYTKDSRRRDFRWLTGNIDDCSTFVISGGCFQPILFRQKNIRPSIVNGVRTYTASIASQEERYGAFFVELWFAGPEILFPYIFTTEAVIVPNQFPYADCHGGACRGILV